MTNSEKKLKAEIDQLTAQLKHQANLLETYRSLYAAATEYANTVFAANLKPTK